MDPNLKTNMYRLSDNIWKSDNFKFSSHRKQYLHCKKTKIIGCQTHSTRTLKKFHLHPLPFHLKKINFNNY